MERDSSFDVGPGGGQGAELGELAQTPCLCKSYRFVCKSLSPLFLKLNICHQFELNGQTGGRAY